MKLLLLLTLLVIAFYPTPTSIEAGKVFELLREEGLPEDFRGVALVGFRGWEHRDERINRRGEYDDILVMVDVTGSAGIAPGARLLGTWRFNADPSRSGYNRRRGKYYGRLAPGLYWYVRGLHRRRVPGLRQAPGREGSVKLIRDKSGRVVSGHFGINFHPGGRFRTGSDGCQTLPPSDWREFKPMIYEITRERGQNRIPYLLVNTAYMDFSLDIHTPFDRYSRIERIEVRPLVPADGTLVLPRFLD